MSIAVVTSCSKQGFEQYGRKCIESFHEFWPKDINLYIVSEDDLPPPSRLAGRDACAVSLHQSVEWAKFREVHKTDLRVSKTQRHPNKQFRYDAEKFCKKVFAVQLVERSTEATRLIWLDADTVTHAPVPVTFLNTLPPDDLAIAYLDRGQYHSECGFVGYNLSYPGTGKFITECARMYSSGDVFGLKQWHDCEVFDHVRKKTGIMCYKIPYGNNPSHPFVHSQLGQYMDHLKGLRKARGASHDHPRYRKPPTSKRR